MLCLTHGPQIISRSWFKNVSKAILPKLKASQGKPLIQCGLLMSFKFIPEKRSHSYYSCLLTFHTGLAELRGSTLTVTLASECFSFAKMATSRIHGISLRTVHFPGSFIHVHPLDSPRSLRHKRGKPCYIPFYSLSCSTCPPSSPAGFRRCGLGRITRPLWASVSSLGLLGFTN